MKRFVLAVVLLLVSSASVAFCDGGGMPPMPKLTAQALAVK